MTQSPDASLPRATFARPVAFDLACPHCATVDSIGRGRRPWKTSGHFNPVTSKWRCPTCRRSFVIGLAIWPVRRTGNRQRGVARPADARPTLEQMGELRQLYGVVRQQTRGRGDPVNLVCQCLDRDDFKADCPVHGSDVQVDEKREGG